MFKLRTALAAGLCCLLLTSCNVLSLSGAESLLVAPILNKRQELVSRALETTVPLRSIIYKYPQYGEYRSPFVFYDLDGDEKEEAIVFYTSVNDTNGYVRFKIFIEKENGEWTPFYDYASESAQVEFVQFKHILSQTASCILIGWQGQGRQSSTLSIHSVKDGTCRMEANPKYFRYCVEDFNGDGLSEAVVINQDSSQRRFSVGLWRGVDGHVEPAGQLYLAEEVEDTLSLISGKLWDGSGAVYIDELLSGGPSSTVATEVIRVGIDGLTLLAGDEATEPGQPESTVRVNYEDTFRDDEILCADVNGDGFVEVPYMASLPGPDMDSDVEALKLTRFMHLTADGFVIRNEGVINPDAGYLVYFPERWSGQVTVERGLETGEWHFRKWNAEMQEPAEELLRIRVTASGDFRDVFEEYADIAAKGAITYSAYIPNLPGEPLAVTKDEVEEMFLLLPA